MELSRALYKAKTDAYKQSIYFKTCLLSVFVTALNIVVYIYTCYLPRCYDSFCTAYLLFVADSTLIAGGCLWLASADLLRFDEAVARMENDLTNLQYSMTFSVAASASKSWIEFYQDHNRAQ
jgi:hypothetical protein